MAHAQKPDLVFQRNGRVPLNWRGGQFSRLLAAGLCASVVVMVVMLDTPCSAVACKTTGYPLHSRVSPFTSPAVCHQVSAEVYQCLIFRFIEKGLSWIVIYRFRIFLYALLWVLSCCLSINNIAFMNSMRNVGSRITVVNPLSVMSLKADTFSAMPARQLLL